MQQLRSRLEEFIRVSSQVILDKDRELKLTLCCLLADGHLLIEDIPGVGKTTLVKMLGRLLGLKMSRIQFTNDLLPGDILGSSIFDPKSDQFRFHPGPIFSELVLADELNRATPKTQSACLQAMEERRVSVDGRTHLLPSPFFLIATQNPRQQIGTFSLPESQLDRFLMRIELGYPSREAERLLLLGEERSHMVDNLQPILNPLMLQELQALVKRVSLSHAIVDYMQDLIEQSRKLSGVHGLSPRGALSLRRAAQAWAFLNNRDYIIPEDVQAVAASVMSHRLNPIEDLSGQSGERSVQEILNQVPVDFRRSG